MFYTGESLLYIGVQNNDTLETIIVKINQAFQNAGVGYAFTNGLIQPTPFQPVQLGGALIQNTTIGGNFTLSFTGNVQAARHITTGGSSSQFVKGDGTLDSTAYQPAANYITGLSGDATASGPGVAAMTLATVNFSSGTFGNGNTIPIVTVNAKGLVTNITPVPVTIPPLPLTFIGDVVGSGFTGTSISLLLQNVNANPYNTITPLKFSVNGKGLVTSASPITASDIVNILGYYPGTSGTSGTDGTSGTSGTAGTSGTSGTDGSGGTSGTSGTSGTTGTSGTSATSGTSGTSGTDGTGGTSGTSGSTGTSGSSGTSGSTGTSGTSGTTGTSGSSGTSGSTGTSGSSGTTGTSGSSGTTGTSGSSGTSGTTGTSGSSGTSGTTGTSGTSGLSGDRFKTSSTTTYTLQSPGGTGTITVEPGLAYTVAQSVIISYDAFNYVEAEVSSYDSITGALNFIVFRLEGSGTYSSWFVNIDGASGGDGSSGSSGTSGTSATAGTSGTTGTSGSSGTSGTTGTSGSSGTSGTSATDGTGGTSGTSGSSGTSGTTGTSGTSATSGTSGTSATSGTTGTSGTSGTNGTGGTSGTSGSSATSGTSGTSGVNGAPGASGTSGTSGTSVAVSGTTNTMAKFTSSTTIGNSALTDDGSVLSYSGGFFYLNNSVYLETFNTRNLIVKSTGGSDSGILGRGSSNEFAYQLYGSGPDYGFLNSAWGSWDLRKNNGGAIYLNNQSTYYYDDDVAYVYRVYGTADMRSPIYYDLDNTGYYVDAASTTALYDLTLVGAKHTYLYINPGNGYEAMVRYNGGSGSGWYAGKRTSGGINSTADFHFYSEAAGADVFGISTGGTAIASGDMRSPIFYDSNDTSYYLNPNSTSVLNAVNYWGVQFWNGDGVYARGTNSYGYRFNNYADTINAFIINNSGDTTSYSSSRAPIFYDSNNTGYYLDPASTSNLNVVQAASIRNDGSVASDDGFGIYWDNGASPAYGIFREGGAWAPPFPDLLIAFHTGIKLGANSSYNGIRFYDDYTMVTEVMSVNNGSSPIGAGHVYVNNVLQAGSDLRAPIFYDSNNTGYYIDPASGSRMNSITYDNLYFSGDTTYGFLGRNVYADTVNGRGSDPLELNYYDGGDVHIGAGASKALRAGTVYSSIFYDSNNTGYYGDFGGASRMDTLHANFIGVGQAINTSYRIITSGDYYANAGGNYWAEGRFKQYRGSGTWHDVIDSGNIGSQSVNYANSAGSASSASYAGYLPTLYAGGVQSNPQTYFNNGIGLRVAMTGHWSVWSDTLWINGYAGGDVLQMCALHTLRNGQPRIAISAQASTSTSYGTVYELWSSYNMDAPNKSGTSYYQVNTWMQFNGTYGLYWPSYYGAHFSANDLSSYTQFALRGSKSSYGGIYDSYSAVAGIMYDGGGNGGVYREANSRWYFYYHLGNDCMGVGTSSTSSTYSLYLNKGIYAQSRIDATIFYDTNNTGYYLDPASGSYLNGISTTNYLTASNCNLAVTGIAGQITLTTNTGFGGYFRATEHIVIENTTGGYHVYVLDQSGVGVVKYSGAQSWSAHSDARIKNVHSTLENNLSKLDGINPIYYSFNNFDDDKNRIGLIAQEVQKHFPELVAIDPKTDNLTLDYTGLIPVLLGAIKELKNKVETLETKI